MKKLLSVWLAALLCLVGCTNEEIANALVKKGSIQATFENNASRLAVGEGNALTWSEGDAFQMFNEAGNGSTWTLEGAGGEETGTFGGEELEGTLKGAAFPALTNPSLADDVLTMTLPKEVTFKEGICNLPMWASFESLDAAVSFKHLGALLKINFSEIPAGYNTLTVTADKPLAGVFTADLSKAEPVLAAAEQGAEKSVKITFDASTSKQDKMFYLPLPVGEYASIKVTIQGEDNLPELTIAEWANRTIVRKKVYLASLTYKTSTAVTTADVDTDLGDTKTITLEVTEKVTDVTEPVTLPTDAVKVGLNFTEVPETSANTPLTIEETQQANEAELSISIPASDTPDSYLALDVPNTTVTVESGNYQKIIARTASNTLILGADVTVDELVILGGNVVLDGAKVTGSIGRTSDNSDEVTFVYVKGTSTLQGVELGEKVQEPDYLTFKAETAQTLTMSKAVETLEYSVGGAAWAELGTATIEFGPAGDLRVRGKSAMGTAASDSDVATVTFGNETSTVAASGDIRTLVDYENYTNDALDTSNARFCDLFRNCAVLTSAPALPATTLAANCYRSMFQNCTALTSAPALPATALAEYCYANMFQTCSALTEAPALPATTLHMGCYGSMFSGCTSLAEAPELPATTMLMSCYAGMFQNCTSLTEAPALPATTLAMACYSLMFDGCTGLTKAPELPAAKLENSCYNMMFIGCTNLAEVTMLATDISVDRCLNRWLENTAASGTLYINGALTDTSALNAPEGWTVKGAYQIRYTSTDGNIVNPTSSATFNANIVSNTYADGIGIIQFDGPVTAIGPNSFSECATLASIEIPNTVTYIGSNAFQYCSGLTSIEIPNSVTNLGQWTFFYCDALKSVKLSENITEIKPHTFNRCEALESIVIPDGVTSIGERAFGTNMKLASVTFPKELVTIGRQAFCYCNSLSTVTLHEKVTSIASGAFSGCI
ncbi:MAG: leucine-rich repeat domain-containing protein [Bacteroidaceae bacterium]|nr:leucine-rich repeat domain-containing protein [Bacteroidaceae bacterium]